MAEIEREEASGKVVEHVPGVVLSLPMRREAAELRGNQAALRLALLRSSCSAEGALHHEEADLQGRIAELEGDAERHAARLEGQRRRALQVGSRVFRIVLISTMFDSATCNIPYY